MSRFLNLLVALVGIIAMASAFAPLPSRSSVATQQQHRPQHQESTTTTTAAFVFGKKQAKEDLSYIETRDMTRAEMEELNRQNEDIMNMELSAMTAFSLVISLPILYLCWVAFFSD
jgi:hypothetical protein